MCFLTYSHPHYISVAYLGNGTIIYSLADAKLGCTGTHLGNTAPTTTSELIVRDVAWVSGLFKVVPNYSNTQNLRNIDLYNFLARG